ncbi:MAG: hypothetical protein ACR2P1_13785, partial [Pseudomonadales bacterium]
MALLDRAAINNSLAKPVFFALACASAQANTAAAASTSEPVKLYVATMGNDAADGGRDRPFATLERARNELRKLRAKDGLDGGAHVIIRGGVYELGNTLQLESKDSGTIQAPIVYRAYTGEKVVLSGGRTLDSCRSLRAGLISCDTQKLQLQKLEDMGHEGYY